MVLTVVVISVLSWLLSAFVRLGSMATIRIGNIHGDAGMSETEDRVQTT